MIINIRGTHGSGKSTVVREFLKQCNATPESVDKRGKPLNYEMNLPDGSLLYVVGGYANACGGCDGIQPYALIWPRVVKFAEHGHVLFEGALVSSSYGNIGRESAVYGDDFIFAFMDTPIEVCLDRIRKRREARGDTRPLNPKNTEGKYNSILKSIPKIRDEFKRRVVMVDHRNPYSQLLDLLQNA